MKRRSFLAGAMLAGLVTAAGPALAADKANPDTLRVALLPDENASTIVQNAQPLKHYLQDRLKKGIELVVTTDYSSMIEAMRFGRIEIAYFGPLSYVLAKSKAPDIEPFAVGVSDGSPTYKSVIITQAGGSVSAVADIKGKMMAYGDQASTSSHLIPRALLADHGLEGDRDYRYAMLGAHDAVALAVASGKVQAGGMSQPIYERLVAKGTIDGEKVKVIAESDPIPNYPMAMQGYLDPALKASIRDAFLKLKDPKILKAFRAEGFVATDDRAYDILRRTAKVLNLDIAQMN